MASRNIKGLDDPKEKSNIISLIRRPKLMAISLIEARVRSENKDKVMQILRISGWEVIDNYGVVRLDAIWILYNPLEVKI